MKYQLSAATLLVYVVVLGIHQGTSLKCYTTHCEGGTCDKKEETVCDDGVKKCAQMVDNGKVTQRACDTKESEAEETRTPDGCHSVPEAPKLFVCFCATDLCNDASLVEVLPVTQ